MNRHAVFGYYHRVFPWSPDPGQRRLAVAPDSLIRHAQLLKQAGFQITTVSEAARAAAPVAALSFDDGYADNLQHAAPALASVGAVGTVYVIAGQLDHPLPTGEGRGEGRADRMLTQDEVRELSRAGWEIGSHSLSHANLSEATEKIQREEIFDSKKRLEDAIGKPVTSLAYPYGLYSELTLRLVEEAGYQNAVTTAKRGGGDSVFNIPRISLGGYGVRALKQTWKLRWHILRARRCHAK